MRTEISEILNKALRQSEERYYRIKQKVSSGNFENYQPTDEEKDNLQRQSDYWQKLIKCLRSYTSFIDAYAGSAGSIVIAWDKNLKNGNLENNIVIELSKYGPLAAVFIYGTPPEEVINHVDTCMAFCGLVRLTNDEISELESQGQYHTVF